jgi:hypothetical protein
MTGLDQLIQQQYLNLETYRKSGVGVKTPVSFVQDGETIFGRGTRLPIRVKWSELRFHRIHNNGQVNIAPCKMEGALLGDWIPATAREVTDSSIDQKANHLLDQKYGLMKKMFALTSALKSRKYTVLEINEREDL